MVSAINSALSGLNAAGKRLEVSANNIANQSSTDSKVDGKATGKPFTPQQVQQVSLQGGGVQTVVRDSTQPTVRVPVPAGTPNADENGTIEAPNVNLEQELINQKIATYDYKANLKTLKVEDNLLQSLLDIKS